MGDPAAPTLCLRSGLAELFPELENVRVTHSWFGNVAMHLDMLPRIFENDGVVYATGFCGSGVVWAPGIGTCAAYKLMGHSERARTAFDFRPPAFIPFYRGNPWFMPAIIQIYRLQDRIALWHPPLTGSLDPPVEEKPPAKLLPGAANRQPRP